MQLSFPTSKPEFVDQLHDEIIRVAIPVANDRLLKDTRVPFYRPLFNAGPSGELALSYPMTIVGSDQEEIIREIGAEAIRQVLINRPDLSVGLIIGEARHGRDFTEIYK